MHKINLVLLLPALATLAFGAPLPGCAEVLEKSEYLLRVMPDDIYAQTMLQQETSPAPAVSRPPAAVTIKRVTQPVQVPGTRGAARNNTSPGTSSSPCLKSPRAINKDKAVPAGCKKAVIT